VPGKQLKALDQEQGLSIFHRSSIVLNDFNDLALELNLNLIEHFHRLNQAQHLPGFNNIANLTEDISFR